MGILILGPQGSGKGFLHNVLAECPALPQPGSFQMQSAPAKRLRPADRYILVVRARAVESIQRRYWSTMDLDDARTTVATAWKQIRAHVADAPTIEVDYRAMVTDLPTVIGDLARFLAVAPWQYQGAVFDGDEDWG